MTLNNGQAVNAKRKAELVDSEVTVDFEPSEANVAWLESLVESSRDMLAISDTAGRLLFLNSVGRALVGVVPDESIATKFLYNCFQGNGEAQFVDEILPKLRATGAWEIEGAMRNAETGSIIPIAISASMVHVEGAPEPREIVWSIRDHRGRQELNRQIAQRVQEHRAVAELAKEALEVRWLDLVRHAVKAVADILDVELVVFGQPIDNSDSGKLHIIAKHDVVAMNLTVLGGGANSQAGYVIATGEPIITTDIEFETRVDTTIVRRYGMVSGMAVPMYVEGKPWAALSLHTMTRRFYTGDDVAFLQAIASVLSSAQSRVTIERQLRHQVLHDPLTGLPNRALALDRLQHALETSGSTGSLVAVVMLDLDDFKTINDSLGHESGDRLLRDLVPRLEAVLHESDTLARLGGDEFLIICEDVATPLEAVDLANKICEAWEDPFVLDERSVFLSGSIGITLGDQHSQAMELVREADTAMYRAKHQGLGQFALYAEIMGEASSDRFKLAMDLHAAIEQDQLWLAFQPIIDLRSGKIDAVEALCRWHHPERGEISPEVFIKLAEETGQIGDLGLWVIEQATKAAAGWQKVGVEVGLRVNVSALQVQHDGFVDEVRGVLRRSQFTPRLLGLEVTEGILLEPGEKSHSVLQQLRDMGVELLVDDYGTGYSSLGALVRFSQMSALKIDKEFVQLTVDERHRAIIESMVSLGHSMGMKVIAEGVETQKQLECVQRSGCDYAQGFLLGHPVTDSEMLILLELEITGEDSTGDNSVPGGSNSHELI